MQNTIIKSIVSLGLSCLSLSVLAAAAPQTRTSVSAVMQQPLKPYQLAVHIKM